MDYRPQSEYENRVNEAKRHCRIGKVKWKQPPLGMILRQPLPRDTFFIPPYEPAFTAQGWTRL